MADLQKNKEAGQVVDLKKMAAKKNSPEEKPAEKSQGGFFAFNFFFAEKNKSRYTIDFLKQYRVLEKKEEFIDQEILKEFLDEEGEKEKKSILAAFFNFIAQAAKLWWLPVFAIRFIWILFWRIFKLFFQQKNKKDFAPRKEEAKSLDLRKKLLIKEIKKSRPAKVKTRLPKISWKFFWQIFLAPFSALGRFLSGKTTEDYLCQRVLYEEINKKNLNPFRRILIFVVLTGLVSLPLKAISYYNLSGYQDMKGRVLGASEEAIGNLQAAAGSAANLNMAEASGNFSAAQKNFTAAKEQLAAVNSAFLELGKIIPNEKIRLASYGPEILSAGEAAASLGNNLSLAANAFFNGDKDKKLSAMIEDFSVYERLALSDARQANTYLNKIEINALPEKYRAQFRSLKASAADLEIILDSTLSMAEKINIFLGKESDKRYLFVFENNSEMRASGGFVGSFALVDFSQGKIKNIETPGGGSYDTKGGLSKFIAAPEPLWLVNNRWQFWDANWWPDWEKSAQKLSWFYEKSGGPTVDGVIAFTPTVLEKILSVIGPIDMTEKYGVVMTADNLWENLRTIIEKEKAADQNIPYEISEKKPKRVIGDLFEKIMQELPGRIDREKFIRLVSGLNENLEEKQILFYFKDDVLQKEAENRNWGGRIKETNKDYLFVVNTNIAGGKTDSKIEEIISHEAAVESDGTIIDTVTITRIHHGIKDEPFYGVPNVDYLRVYAPLGSELLEASGFSEINPIYFTLPKEGWEKDSSLANEESGAIVDKNNLNTKIYQESGKTVFANWIMVDPENTATAVLKYKLPFKLEKRPEAEIKPNLWEKIMDKISKVEKKDLFVYSLLAQKQAGANFSSLKTALKLPNNFKAIWKYPAGLPLSAGGWEAEEKLEADKYFAVVLESAKQ